MKKNTKQTSHLKEHLNPPPNTYIAYNNSLSSISLTVIPQISLAFLIRRVILKAN